MKAFQFSLERVLQWRATQLHLAEEKLSQTQNLLAQLSSQEQMLVASYQNTAAELVSWAALGGAELHRLSAFRERTLRLRQAVHVQKVSCEALIREQQQQVLEAKKQHRILEKLKERQWENWQYLHEREIENTAADSYLANWVRERDAREPEQSEKILPEP